MARYAFVVDLDRCVGCRACVEACKIENNTSEGVFWMHVFRFEEGTYPNVNESFLPRPCMHCDNAPCVSVCPTGARYKREDGFVLTNYDICIGCRYCEVSCPYGVNFFNWKDPRQSYYYDWNAEGDDVYGSGSIKETIGDVVPPYRNPDLYEPHGPEQKLNAGGGHRVGIIEKCTWCVHRVERGLDPACVANCPAFALLFGDLEDPESKVSRILSTGRHTRLLEELGTEPRVYYVGSLPTGAAKPIHIVQKVLADGGDQP
ncbi:MAG: 4Fe-4S dicluster domain-containing protein [Candidatus Geothermarchaeales archaeon]